MERMINNRLYYLAETKGWLSHNQAGFRKGRSCEDQILKLIHHASDGFQAKKPMRTVMALLDYSKAYDTVWKERLYLNMVKKGVPIQMIRWIKSFLNTRTAQVMINGTLSKKVRMKQGLPQGSVLSPLLFLLFINDIVDTIPEDVEISLFADDAALYTSHTDINKANRSLQDAVTAIEVWSKNNKLTLNTDKSCTFFFSTDTHEAKWRPTLRLLGKEMKFGEGNEEINPKFLGITLDRTLSFQDHVQNICERVVSRCKMLSCLSGKSWGWAKHNLVKIFTATQRSVLDYAAGAWHPWLSKCQYCKVETKRCQLVSGQSTHT